jgi:hypothetical protein
MGHGKLRRATPDTHFGRPHVGKSNGTWLRIGEQYKVQSAILYQMMGTKGMVSIDTDSDHGTRRVFHIRVIIARRMNVRVTTSCDRYVLWECKRYLPDKVMLSHRHH